MDFHTFLPLTESYRENKRKKPHQTNGLTKITPMTKLKKPQNF